MTSPESEVVEVVAMLGDTTLEIAHVSTQHFADGFAIEASGDGFMFVRDEGVPGERIICETPIVANVPMHVRVGLVDYTIARIPAPVRSIPHPAVADRRAVTYIAISLAVHLAVWAFAGDPRPEPDRLAVETARPRKVRMVPSMFGEPGSPSDRIDSIGLELNGGGAPVGDGGGLGRLASNGRERAVLDRLPAGDRGRAIEQAREAGILGPLSARPGALTAIAGTGDIAHGFAGTPAPRTAEPRGGFGGGRSGWGTICEPPPGPCRFGTIGTGHFSTTSYNEQFGGIGGGRARTTTIPSVKMCGARVCPDAVEGGLDKAVVRRYIKRALHKITYCYEKELLAEPELGGELTVDFIISTTGVVSTSEAHGVSATVASCVAGVISKIEFPRAIGETTRVHYPFTMRSTG